MRSLLIESVWNPHNSKLALKVRKALIVNLKIAEYDHSCVLDTHF